MTLKRILFLLFVIAIMKYGIGHKTNYSAEIPLLDNQNLPLVAQFDTTKLNQVLKIAIKKTIEETMNEMIPRIKQAVLADIGYGMYKVHVFQKL